jgi:hypothetical protein
LSGHLVDPVGYLVYQFRGGRRLGVPHAGPQPQLPGLTGGRVQLAGVLRREVRVVVPVHDQQRRGRDPGGGFGRRNRDRVPAFRAHPRLQHPAREGAAEPALHCQVHLSHPLGAAVVPTSGAAHRHRGVHTADQAGVPEHHRGAHREADRGDPLVAELAGPGHRDVQVLYLPVPQRGQAAGTAVTAEVEDHHASLLVQPGGDPPHVRPLPGQRETVRDHDREISWPWQMGGVDRHAILGNQGHRGYDSFGHALTPTLRLPGKGSRCLSSRR